MAPNGEILSNPYTSSFTIPPKPTMKLSAEGLKRAISDLSFELSQEAIDIVDMKLPAIPEVEDAKCECCEVLQECTPEYIKGIRNKFSGRWICGLCSEAVKEEMEKNGGKKEEAINEHMGACIRFNRFGRTHPVLYQAEAMKDMLRKSSRVVRAKSSSPRDNGTVKKGGFTRSSSCISAITKEFTNLRLI